MTKTITLNGEDYELRGDPKMGTVKHVQEMQIDILRKYLDDEAIAQMDAAGQDDMMEQILEGSEGIENLKGMMWDNNLLAPAQTIILATDHKFALDEFQDLRAGEFRDAKEEAEIALGTEADPQDAAGFMTDLGIDTSSQAKRIQEEVQDQTSENTSQEPLLNE